MDSKFIVYRCAGSSPAEGSEAELEDSIMALRGTVVTVGDNSGAKRVRLIGRKGRKGLVGSRWSAAVIEAAPDSRVPLGSVVQVVRIRSRGSSRDAAGWRWSFDETACVLVNKEGAPVGTRVFGLVPRSRRRRGYGKLVTRAEGVY